MTAVRMTDCFGDIVILPDPQEAAKLFDEQVRLIMPIGRSGQAIWVGTEDDTDILRIDIDIDEGRAALRWLPDGSHAVELEPGPAIETYATDDGEIAHISGTLARVSPSMARTAVAEFVATGRRPTCVAWQE
jgi:Immunity protein Imm1